MTHATIYFKGQTDFNEQMATFIGNQGAIEFLEERYGLGSKEVAKAHHIQEDDLLFSQWIDHACQHLSNFYAKDIGRDEKLEGRKELFNSIRGEFKQIKGQLKTDGYKDFEKINLNNAVLLAYRRYFRRLERFQALYTQLGGDIRKVVEYFKAIQVSGDKVVLQSFSE
jgi:predicted aminopeptidase